MAILKFLNLAIALLHKTIYQNIFRLIKIHGHKASVVGNESLQAIHIKLSI